VSTSTNDIKYAFRQMRKSPGFTVVAVLTLAICVAANIVIFAVTDAILIRPLPFPEADRMVIAFHNYPGAGVEHQACSLASCYEWREAITAFESASASQAGSVVIGVMADVHHSSLSEDIGPSIYFLYSAMTSERNMGFIVRSDTEPLNIIPAVRSAIWELDPALPISELTSMNQRIAQTFSRQRFLLAFLGISGTFALILVVVGIYGVVAFVVSQRTQELGIRMALGAQQRHILVMILRKGLALAILGSIFGVAGALGLTRFLSGALYGIGCTDPVTFVMIPLLLTGVTLLACYLPARRAAKIDPMEVLRYE
jgi:hypothetical protein